MATWHNWARTESSSPYRFDTPDSTAELATAIARAAEQGRRVKAVGAGHSFTGVAVTDGTLLSLDRMTGIETVSPTATGALVSVRAGTRLHDLSEHLWALGLALPNLGDIDVQSVAGAISTGTHGTGSAFTGLAAQVRAVTTVLADGSVVECAPEQEPELFEVSRLGIGAFGVLSSVTFDCVSAFRLRAHEAPASLSETLDGLHDRLRADHFEFYWFPHTDGVLTKSNTRLPGTAPVDPVGRIRGFVDDEILSNGVFNAFQHLGTGARVDSTAQFRVVARIVGAHVHRSQSPGVRVESACAIQGDGVRHTGRRATHGAGRNRDMAEPLRSADRVPDRGTIRGRRRCLVVHRPRPRHRLRGRAPVPPQRAPRLLPGSRGHRSVRRRRPHWGKLHGLTAAELSEAYPRFDDVLAVRDRVDPQRVFDNAYLQRVLGA